MRPIAINQRALWTAGEELDSPREALHVQAGDRADAGQRTVEILERREQTALDSLERLALADRPPEEIAAQADRVAALHRELAEARTETRDLEVTADREQAEADSAARNLRDRLG